MYNGTFLRLEQRLCPLCLCRLVASAQTAIRAFKQTAASVINVTKKREHIALVAVHLLRVTKPRLLLPWSGEKNQTMRQQAYYCVISGATRHQCNCQHSYQTLLTYRMLVKFAA